MNLFRLRFQFFFFWILVSLLFSHALARCCPGVLRRMSLSNLTQPNKRKPQWPACEQILDHFAVAGARGVVVVVVVVVVGGSSCSSSSSEVNCTSSTY